MLEAKCTKKVVMLLLTAQTKDGKKFCLAYRYNKATLMALRDKEEFFCPVCGERVFLKLGDVKIYHFAHQKGGNCRELYENETECHLQGKLQLYEWLRNQKIPAAMEYYDRAIGQRPDILFSHHGRKYALEYQCSSIPGQIFQKRTKRYLLHGYTPLWILGKNDQVKSNHHASITNFQYLFLRKTQTGQMFIPIFSPNQKAFLMLSSIYPYTTKKALVNESFLPIKHVKLSNLLEPGNFCGLTARQWRIAMERFIHNYFIYPNVNQRAFLQEIYQHRLNLFLLPPEIGLPVASGVHIQTPPMIWQLYYYLDVLMDKQPGDLLRLQDLENMFARWIRERKVQVRRFPQIDDGKPFLAAVEYTHLLAGLGVLTQKAEGLFRVCRNLKIPQTNREKEEMMQAFYQYNRKIPLT